MLPSSGHGKRGLFRGAREKHDQADVRSEHTGRAGRTDPHLHRREGRLRGRVGGAAGRRAGHGRGAGADKRDYVGQSKRFRRARPPPTRSSPRSSAATRVAVKGRRPSCQRSAPRDGLPRRQTGWWDRGRVPPARRPVGGTDEGRRLLEEEGVEFDRHGRVLPEYVLGADELRRHYEGLAARSSR